MKATTKRLKRSSMIPLRRRYRAERMATENLDARVKSIHGQQYCQVFGNKDFFVEAYPIEKRSDLHETLYRLGRDYRA